MLKRKSKADRRLRKIKIAHQREIQRLRREFGEQWQGVERLLLPLIQSQCFYHEALMHLLTSESEPDSDTLIGAMLFQRWINNSNRELYQTITTYRANHLA